MKLYLKCDIMIYANGNRKMTKARFLALVITLASVLYVHTGWSHPPEYYRVEPQANEKLSAPVLLECAGMEIIEWRASRYFTKLTALSSDGVKVINQLCMKAIDRYPEFLKSKKFTFTKKDLKIKISLMPANIRLDGKDFRNLNDFLFRFKFAFSAGCCVWGLYFDPFFSMFLRNDPIYIVDSKPVANKYFVRTFLHEMAHAFDHQWLVRELNFPDNDLREEEIAEEWIVWLGINYGTESPEDDLRYKNISIPFEGHL